MVSSNTMRRNISQDAGVCKARLYEESGMSMNLSRDIIMPVNEAEYIITA